MLATALRNEIPIESVFLVYGRNIKVEPSLACRFVCCHLVAALSSFHLSCEDFP